MSCRPAFASFFRGGVVVLLLLLSFALPCAAVVYVDKDRPGGNGTSWAQAYKTLDAALSGTFSAQEFWIAEGTYTPAATLLVTHGHTFYGGFAGNETVRSQRNIAAHPTIVDGRGVLRHVFNVVSFVPSVRFDGLTVKRGAATAASGVDASGGGIVVDRATVVIANCTFTDNNATHLGGALNLVNNPTITITGSTFKNNKSLSGAGGGAGVAMAWDKTGAQPAALVEKSSFQGNAGGAVGGGLYSLNFPVTVRECKFVGNSSANGGAIMLDYKLAAADRIERCLFIANTATERGGAICSYARSVEVENSVFAYNATSAVPKTGGGGAVGLHSGKQPAHYNAAYISTFRNCTFYGNRADSAYGGGIQNIGDRPMYIYNSIFWNNSALSYWMDAADRPTNDIAAYTTATTVHSTDMETLGWPTPPAYLNQTGSFSEDPLCADPVGPDNVAGTADDNLSILDSSPCTDRADATYAPATDIVLRPRVNNPDIGAYEGPYSPPVVVPPPVVPDGISIPPILHLLLGKRF
ncbi:MAG: right-handed parallel beta-helix repeat-containing protein [Desulfobulbaceae bacterium]